MKIHIYNLSLRGSYMNSFTPHNENKTAFISSKQPAIPNTSISILMIHDESFLKLSNECITRQSIGCNVYISWLICNKSV